MFSNVKVSLLKACQRQRLLKERALYSSCLCERSLQKTEALRLLFGVSSIRVWWYSLSTAFPQLVALLEYSSSKPLQQRRRRRGRRERRRRTSLRQSPPRPKKKNQQRDSSRTRAEFAVVVVSILASFVFPQLMTKAAVYNYTRSKETSSAAEPSVDVRPSQLFLLVLY